MSKRSLAFFVPLIVLLFASLACNALTGGGAAGGFQATANAAFTQAAGGAATAGAQGSSLAATASAAATEALATANAATGGNTTGDATATTAASQPTAAATTASGGDGGGPISGGPADIPVVSGQNTVLLATAQVVSYESKTAFDATVKFYKDAMPKNGWTQDAATSVETANATVLAFKKDTRQAQVSITTDPSSKATVVLITIS